MSILPDLTYGLFTAIFIVVWSLCDIFVNNHGSRTKVKAMAGKNVKSLFRAIISIFIGISIWKKHE